MKSSKERNKEEETTTHTRGRSGRECPQEKQGNQPVKNRHMTTATNPKDRPHPRSMRYLLLREEKMIKLSHPHLLPLPMRGAAYHKETNHRKALTHQQKRLPPRHDKSLLSVHQRARRRSSIWRESFLLQMKHVTYRHWKELLSLLSMRHIYWNVQNWLRL